MRSRVRPGLVAVVAAGSAGGIIAVLPMVQALSMRVALAALVGMYCGIAFQALLKMELDGR
jgi:hypothetical protein